MRRQSDEEERDEGGAAERGDEEEEDEGDAAERGQFESLTEDAF